MTTFRRSRVVAAPPPAVWRTVADPKALPRWWPGVVRVEGVDRHSFTEVLESSRGRQVRADYLRGERDEPHCVSWRQQLEGTPFAGVFREREVTVTLEPGGDGGTHVELAVRQLLSGGARFTGALNRGGVRRQLDAALDALDALHHEA